jgi:PST family polysaccharide transporter
LVVGVWVARYLGPERFGLLNFVLTLIGFIGVFARLGLEPIVTRQLVKAPEQRDTLLGTAFALRICAAIVAYAVAIVALRWLRPADATASVIGMIGGVMLMTQACEVTDWWFVSQTRSRLTVIARNIAYSSAALAKIFLIATKGTLVSFACVAVAESALFGLGSFFAYRLTGGVFMRWRFDKQVANVILRSGFSLLLAGVTIQLYMRIDVFMLAHLLGDRAVGIFSAASRISEAWYFIPMAVVSSVTPTLVRSRISDDALYQRRVEHLFLFLVGAMALPAAFVAALSGTLVELLFGPQYAGAGKVLQVHVWASIFVALGVGSTACLVTEGLYRISLYATCIGAVVNILLNLVLIPRYGPTGAAVATVLGQAASGTFSLLFFGARTRDIFRCQIRALTLYGFVSVALEALRRRRAGVARGEMPR